ncbi:MAG: PqqD family protein [Clostridia bacterium]|nr:PqqD family protein [Clostridia bacterium]
MKIKDGFVVERVGSQYLAVAVGERADEFNALVRMNETGAFIFGLLEKKELNEDGIVAAMLDEYDVPRALAEKDVSAFVEKLRKAGLLDE